MFFFFYKWILMLSVIMTSRYYIFWCWIKSLKNSPVTTKVLSLILAKTNSGKSGFRGRCFANWIQMPFLFITRSLACQMEKDEVFSLQMFYTFIFFIPIHLYFVKYYLSIMCGVLVCNTNLDGYVKFCVNFF